MRIRPRDPVKELRNARHALVDAEHRLREMNYGYRHKPSDKLKQQEVINELRAKIEQLEAIIG